jgi:DNA-binding MurR/RpiR family transcriptional regulator
MYSFKFDIKDLSFTNSEQNIIDYIYKNIIYIPSMSIGKIAQDTNISVATISRFVKHVGYKNFKDLKNAILETEKKATPANKISTSLSANNGGNIYNLLVKQEGFLIKTRDYINEKEIEKATDIIINTENIYFFGKGSSKCLVDLFSFRLKRFGKKIFIINSSGSEIFEDLTNIKKTDLVILFGFHKVPIELKVLLNYKNQVKFKTILFTDKLYSKEKKESDINICLYRGEENEYHSMTAPIAIIDSLIVLIAKEIKNNSVNKLDKLNELKENYINKIPRH